MVKQSNNLYNVIYNISCTAVLLRVPLCVSLRMFVFVCPSVCYHLAKNDQAGGLETYF